jgi:hypothetical protein
MAGEMADLLLRGDLPSDRPTWWDVVISVCNSGLLSAEVGAVDAEQWAELLVRALDRARELGSLGKEEVLHRRMIACAAAVRYFGARAGDPARDPELIFAWLLGELGSSPEVLLRDYQRMAQPSKEVQADRDLYRDIRWLASIRMALESLCDVVVYMPDGPRRAEAVKWCEVARLISK